MVVLLDARGRRLRVGDPCEARVFEDLTVSAVVVGRGLSDELVAVSVPAHADEEGPQRFDLPLTRVLLVERT